MNDALRAILTVRRYLTSIYIPGTPFTWLRMALRSVQGMW